MCANVCRFIIINITCSEKYLSPIYLRFRICSMERRPRVRMDQTLRRPLITLEDSVFTRNELAEFEYHRTHVYLSPIDLLLWFRSFFFFSFNRSAKMTFTFHPPLLVTSPDEEDTGSTCSLHTSTDMTIYLTTTRRRSESISWRRIILRRRHRGPRRRRRRPCSSIFRSWWPRRRRTPTMRKILTP